MSNREVGDRKEEESTNTHIQNIQKGLFTARFPGQLAAHKAFHDWYVRTPFSQHGPVNVQVQSQS